MAMMSGCYTTSCLAQRSTNRLQLQFNDFVISEICQINYANHSIFFDNFASPSAMNWMDYIPATLRKWWKCECKPRRGKF
ncbi:unnamed protein product [Litomosoides sigmodontis]|uniref:Uncharacterized protein n=1 Tax=Litomosoides sigmodontis TaxID=42156 RepID=A0A3P6T4D6_LITSI|nr:unnamed protein product [Litomosoides sigmodontis]